MIDSSVHFLKFLEDRSLFCWPLIPPVLDFWWRCLWIWNPEWAALFVLSRGIHVTCSLDSPLLQHLPTSWEPAWQPSRSFPLLFVFIYFGFSLFYKRFRRALRWGQLHSDLLPSFSSHVPYWSTLSRCELSVCNGEMDPCLFAVSSWVGSHTP